MTILTMIDAPRDGETFPQSIARRLHGEFGQRRLSMSAAARLVGMSQSQFSRRMTGQLPFDVVELDRLCLTLELDRNYILTGARSLPESSAVSSLLPRVDSNHQPSDEDRQVA